MKKLLTLLIIFCVVVPGITWIIIHETGNRILSFLVDPVEAEIKIFWKDDNGLMFKSIGTLKNYLSIKQSDLIFAMNAGMYQADNSPLGLYIEGGKLLHPLNKMKGNTNFYIKPNGVFYITVDKRARICLTHEFILSSDIKYATQSGPMLLIDGTINPLFNSRSDNLNVRNGVGILPDNKVVFAISKRGISFYDFADFFKERGCKNALFLDGVISKAYCPSKNWIQTGGNFGPIIGVIKHNSN